MFSQNDVLQYVEEEGVKFIRPPTTIYLGYREMSRSCLYS